LTGLANGIDLPQSGYYQSWNWESSKKTWLEGEHHFKKQQTVELTKLYCLPAPQKTIQGASNLKKRKEVSTEARKGYNTHKTWYP